MKKQFLFFLSLILGFLISSNFLYSNPLFTLPGDDSEMTMCAGDTIKGLAGLITPLIDCGDAPQGPFGEVTVEPSDFAVITTLGVEYAELYFHPQETTLYTVTHNGFSCDNPTTVTTLFLITVEECEEEIEEEEEEETETDYPDIFNQYSWLLDKVNPEDCEGTTISVYTKSVYAFIYIETATGGNLYFQDGTFYCTSIAGYNCIDVYGLSGPLSVWTCGEEEEEEEIDGNPEVFNQYPWLLSIINPINCEGTSVTVYTKGIFSFIYVETVTGNILYFEDGGLYCEDGPGYSCVELYALSNIESTWVCGGTPNELPIVFEDFGWLSSIINPSNCAGTSVSVYMKGFYYFIYVQTNGAAMLYFQDGTFYCSDLPGYSCLELYALNEPVTVWNCGDVVPINADFVFCPDDEPLLLPAPPFPPQGPVGDDCPPPFSTGSITISPSVNTTVSGEVITVSPTETTTYTITRSFPGGPGSPPCPSSSVEYIIEVDNDCGVDKPSAQCTENLVPVVVCQEFGVNYHYEDVDVAEEDGTVQILDDHCFRYTPSISAQGNKEISVMICNEDGVCAMIIYPVKVGNCNGSLPSVSQGNPVSEIIEITNRTERLVEDTESRIGQAEMELFTMSPNPTTDRVVVQLSSEDNYQKNITVFDLKGTVVKQMLIPVNSNQSTITIDVASLSTGVYMVHLKTPFNVDVKRLVKQ